ncbi:uncharacterized protein LOC116848070 isoform X2 [Odontomachus brunneus]|nr:uncharacterized protein LOC116848070 isoform X2 [Odontomachus brunneus]
MLYPELQTAEAHELGEKTFSNDKLGLDSNDEFEYLDKYFGVAARMRSAANEREEGRAQNNIATRKKFVPLRNIIKEPTYCQEGERMDINGKCRFVIPTKPEKSWESERLNDHQVFV